MFKVGVPVFNDDFIDRKEELKLLNFYLTECGNQSVMIHAPRRFGKTSLIKESFRIIEVSNKYLLYFDLKHYSSLEYLARDIVEQVYHQLGINKFWENLQQGVMTFLKQIKPKLSVKIYGLVEVTLEPVEKMLRKKDSLEFFLESITILQMVASHIKCDLKVAFDEFQDIYNLTTDKSIIDKLRAIIQHQSNVAYIFCGSHESLMNYIFLDKRSAFFNFGRIISLGALDQQELSTHIIQRFKSIKVMTDVKALQVLLEQLECHPYYTMKTMQVLHGMVISERIKLINADIMQTALNASFAETKSYLEDMVNYIRSKAHHVEILISIASNIDTGLEPLTNYRVKQSLVNMGLIKSISRGHYILIDPFLKRYLLNLN